MSAAVVARLQAHLAAAMADEVAFTASRNHGLAAVRRGDAAWLRRALERGGILD